jgi:hypothetical protein
MGLSMQYCTGVLIPQPLRRRRPFDLVVAAYSSLLTFSVYCMRTSPERSKIWTFPALFLPQTAPLDENQRHLNKPPPTYSVVSYV